MDLKRTFKKSFVVLLLAVVVAFSLAHMVPDDSDKSAPPLPEVNDVVQVRQADGSVREVALEEYVVGVVSAEMPVSFSQEALKAQAVASRTYVLSRDLVVDDTTSSQVYEDEARRREKWKEDFEANEAKIEACVEATKGEVLTYQGQYISALFFSSSNGKTENNEDYFNTVSVPYLRSVDSSWDLEVSSQVYREKSFTKEELNQIFETDDFTLTILSYKESGRVDQVDVSGKTYTGREIREKLGLASSDFDIEQEGDTYIFHTVGYGHGVGMSQYGAQGMAEEGYDYRTILTYYYQGVEIEKLHS